VIALAVAAAASGKGGALVGVWGTAAMLLKAAVHVPLGLLLVGAGGAIIWHWPTWLVLLIGGWLIFSGGNLLFGSLAGFVVPAGADQLEGAKPADRAALRRAGLIDR
jgi:hypothetical protein